MTKSFRFKLAAVGAVLLMVFAVATATAQNPKLTERIDALEERVTVLEGFHENEPEPTPTPTPTATETPTSTPTPTPTAAEPEPVVPDIPEVIPATCDAESSLTVPDDTDVFDYEGPFGSTGVVNVTVELKDKEQYVLDNLSGTGWVLETDGEATFADETDPPLDCEAPSGDRPNETTTGPTDTAALDPVGSFEVETDGAVIENVDVSGRIKINANNVTVRNFRVVGGGALYTVHVESGITGTVIEDGEITTSDSAGVYCQSACTLRGLHIHDHDSDGMKLDGRNGQTLVESSFITRLGMSEGSHADGMQTVLGENITLRNNNFYMPVEGTEAHDELEGGPFGSNATFIIHDETDNILIENNWLNGGNYTGYGSHGTTVLNNVIGPDYRFGYCNGPYDEWSGNVFEDGTPAPCDD